MCLFSGSIIPDEFCQEKGRERPKRFKNFVKKIKILHP